MFYEARAFNQPLDVRHVQGGGYAWHVSGARAFNQPLTSFDTAQVTDMRSMFCDATAFNQPLTFDTSKVTDMSGMFCGATAFNQPLTFTDTSQGDDYGGHVS